MVDFELTEEQNMFREMAKEFGLREVLPSARERDRQERYPDEIMKKMGNQGLLGIKIPCEYGGLGLDWMTFGLVMEQISYYDFSVGISYLTQTTLQAMPILSHGDESQKRRYIPAILRGEKLGCHAAVEPNAGSDATAIETKAVRSGEEWIINGNKTWITNATVADFAIVLAQTDKGKGTKGITTFLIDRDAPGFSTVQIKNKLGIRSTDTGQLFFRECRIPDSNRLGQVGMGMRVALGSIEHTRFGIAIGAVGVLQACIDSCVKYCQERSQFGKPIGNFQLVQEKIAEMVVDCEAGRGLTCRLAYLKDKGVPHSRETAITKYFCTEAAVRAARTAVELHGAYGYTDDFPVERYYRDMISPVIYGGTSNIQKLTIGSFATGIKAFAT
jgi:alkylation response protein AidB-like acyl-CoA dehydrogenase